MPANKPSDPQNAGPSAGWLSAVIFTLIWLAGLIAFYFWAHKPFDFTILVGLARSLLSFAIWLGLLSTATVVGLILILPVLKDESPPARLLLAAGLGLGLFSLATLVLGAAGGLRSEIVWPLLLLLVFLLRRRWPQLWQTLRAVRLPRPAAPFHWLLLLVILFSLLLTFPFALTPETGWDALVYHLTGPRLFIDAGRLVHPFDLPYLGFPQLGEMQFTLGILLLGDGVPPLLHFGYGLLALGMTAVLAERYFGREAAWWAVALLATVPIVTDLMAAAYVDITLLFYTTATAYLLLRWQENEKRGTLVLLAVFAGFCGGVKYTAVAIPVAVALSVWHHSRRAGTAIWLRRLALLTGVTSLTILPWLLENWFTTGNPVYPFFLPDALYWDSWRAWWYDRPGTGLWSFAPWRLITAPLEATVLGTSGTNLYAATIGPFVLGGLFLLPVSWRRLEKAEKAVAGQLLFLFALNYLVWLVGLARSALLFQTRLLLPLFGVTAVLSGLALQRAQALRRPQLAVDWLLRVFVGLTLGLMVWQTAVTFWQGNPIPVTVGLESPARYRQRSLGIYASGD